MTFDPGLPTIEHTVTTARNPTGRISMNNDQPSRRDFFAGIVGGLLAGLGLGAKAAAAPPKALPGDTNGQANKALVTWTTYDAAGRRIATREEYEDAPPRAAMMVCEDLGLGRRTIYTYPG